MINITSDLKKAWSYLNTNDYKNRPIVVAEIGNNHGGDVKIAKEMMIKAKEAGVDAVKFQTFTEQGVWTSDAIDGKLNLKIATFNTNRRKYIQQVTLSSEEWYEIAEASAEINIPFISTPFDNESVDLLDKLDTPCFKTASMDINNLPFLKYIAKKNKPMIISTGMSTEREVSKAVKTIQDEGNDQIIILHCTSMYPTPIHSANLSRIYKLRELYGLPVGFSDHTVGEDAAYLSTAMGCCMIEKHMTLDKENPELEHFMCAEPQDLKNLVLSVKNASLALGDNEINYLKGEESRRGTTRRSIVTTQCLKTGDIIQESMLTAKRPSIGIPPDQFSKVIGKKINKNIQMDTTLFWEDFD